MTDGHRRLQYPRRFFKKSVGIKRSSAAFQLWNLFLGLYVLLFVTQGYLTWGSIG